MCKERCVKKVFSMLREQLVSETFTQGRDAGAKAERKQAGL